MNTKNFKVGDYVEPSTDFAYPGQSDGSAYGIIQDLDDALYEDGNLWCKVQWVDYKGIDLYVNSYRIGPKEYDIQLYLEQ
jgi:hypothetical protein